MDSVSPEANVLQSIAYQPTNLFHNASNKFGKFERRGHEVTDNVWTLYFVIQVFYVFL